MSENKICEKIEETDRQLFLLNNELSMLEYKHDLGNDEAGDSIDEVYKQISNLLNEPSLLKSVRACLGSVSTRYAPRMVRKAALLEREITFSAIENNSALEDARKSIRRGMKNLDYSKTLFTLTRVPEQATRHEELVRLARAGAAMEPACRELFKIYNNLAQEAGYRDYAQAKLAYEGLTVGEIYTLFRQWRDENLSQWKRALAQEAEELGDTIKAHDLLYILNRRYAQVQEMFDASKSMHILRELLARLGTSLDELPISIEFGDIPFSGSGYRVVCGKDVRLLLNPGLRGIYAYFVLLHEFGHAIYYCHCPVGSELLIDCHLAREIMADLWTHFLKEKSFLTGVMGFPADFADDVIQARREYEAFRLLLYMRDSIFTLEILRHPDIPFAEIWRAVSNEWLGIDDDSGAFETFDFLNPLDMKSYVFAQVISEKTFASFSDGRSDVLETPGVLEAIIDTLYRPGNTIEWQTKFAL